MLNLLWTFHLRVQGDFSSPSSSCHTPDCCALSKPLGSHTFSVVNFQPHSLIESRIILMFFVVQLGGQSHPQLQQLPAALWVLMEGPPAAMLALQHRIVGQLQVLAVF